MLVDRILEHDPKARLVASKNVTAAEEFFEGHFPGAPVMPGVLLMESLAQAAGIWLLEQADDAHALEVHVVGIDDAKFRRPVVPGDQPASRGVADPPPRRLCRMRGEIRAGDARVAEARLLLQVQHLRPPDVHETAQVAPGAVLGHGVRIGPYAVIGKDVELGAGTIVESHAVIAGRHEDGRRQPCLSVRLDRPAGAGPEVRGRAHPPRDRRPQHLPRVRHRQPRHRGRAAAVTRIGAGNHIMAYAHIAHDCQVGDHTIFANNATLGGHVLVADCATVSAPSRRCTSSAASAPTPSWAAAPSPPSDVLPYSKTVGNRACIYGRQQRRPVAARLQSGGDQRHPPRLPRAAAEPARTRSAAVARLEAEDGHGARGAARARALHPKASQRGVILQPAPSARRSRRSDAAVVSAPLGLIAGNGRFPFLVARAARRRGRRVVAVAIREEASARTRGRRSDEIHWVEPRASWASASTPCDAAGVSEAVMAGQVKHRQIFSDIVPDLKLMAVLARLAFKNTDSLIGGVADALARRRHPPAVVDGAAAPTDGAAGRHDAARSRRADEQKDIEYGLGMARALTAARRRADGGGEGPGGGGGRGDGGHRRGRSAAPGRWPGAGCAVVKLAKPRQDLRFDVPVVGPGTLEVMAEARAAVLGVEAGKTLLIDKRRVPGGGRRGRASSSSGHSGRRA